ncbi:hypothetical protein TNCT_669931 [Trichonephila clavata]|uniref:Uncharacterized protein n=1 Tax=Trichonephila clavata TaxID=2740835 RepID=A0A8X6JD39_TRICU|nr:hypothetical protein TNCT_669931 [Trichonephila clavata]
MASNNSNCNRDRCAFANWNRRISWSEKIEELAQEFKLKTKRRAPDRVYLKRSSPSSLQSSRRANRKVPERTDWKKWTLPSLLQTNVIPKRNAPERVVMKKRKVPPSLHKRRPKEAEAGKVGHPREDQRKR